MRTGTTLQLRCFIFNRLLICFVSVSFVVFQSCDPYSRTMHWHKHSQFCCTLLDDFFFQKYAFVQTNNTLRSMVLKVLPFYQISPLLSVLLIYTHKHIFKHYICILSMCKYIYIHNTYIMYVCTYISAYVYA